MAQQNSIMVVVQSNGLGTAGFVVSLISFFCCGLSAPLGLLLSLVALLRPPRGMAFAGAILGGLGSWWLFAFGLAMLGAAVGAKDAAKRAREQQSAPTETPSFSPPSTETIQPPIELEPQKPASKKVASPAPGAGASVPVVRDEPPPLPVKPRAPIEPEKPKARTWRAAEGNFSVQAEFVSMGSGAVKLRKSDGTEISVPIEKLSLEDRRWIQEYRRDK